MEVKEIAMETLHRVEEALEQVDGQQIKKVIMAITVSDRLFVVGSGRSGLIVRSFAHRFAAVGREVYVVGETITPAARTTDTIVVVSGSGETTYTVSAAETGKRMGAKIIAITSHPDSSLGQMADITVTLPGRIETPKDKDYLARQIIGTHEPLVLGGATFELTCMVFLESLIIKLQRRWNP